MQTVKVKMNAGDLKGLIDLPDYPDDQRVTITVNPEVKENARSKEEIRAALDEIKKFWAYLDKNEPHKTLEEYRLERLEKKYGPFN